MLSPKTSFLLIKVEDDFLIIDRGLERLWFLGEARVASKAWE